MAHLERRYGPSNRATVVAGWAETYVAVRAAMAKLGYARSYSVEHEAARQLGVYTGDFVGVQFAAQVRRALNKLADAGELIKVPTRGGEYPDGSRNWGSIPDYYTPEKWAELEKQAEIRRQAQAETRAAWARVWDDLQVLDLTPQSDRGSPIHLYLATWQQLVARLKEA